MPENTLEDLVANPDGHGLCYRSVDDHAAGRKFDGKSPSAIKVGPSPFSKEKMQYYEHFAAKVFTERFPSVRSVYALMETDYHHRRECGELAFPPCSLSTFHGLVRRMEKTPLHVWLHAGTHRASVEDDFRVAAAFEALGKEPSTTSL